MGQGSSRVSSFRGAILAGAGLTCVAIAALCLLVPAVAARATPAARPHAAPSRTLSALVATSTPETTPTAPVSARRTIGHSVNGRRIVLERFGAGKRRILIVAGIHGDEYGGPVAAKFAAYLRTHPSAIPTGTQIDVVAYSNPDGRALKRRTNSRKVDLNRNFPARNWTWYHRRGTSSHGRRPASEPETKALIRLLKQGQYTRVVTLHSRGGVIDYNGMGGRTLAKRIARASHIRLARLGRFPGSMGSYVPEKFHIPIVTWELSSRRLTVRVRSGLLVSTK